jgi:hypothetical protein
MRSWCIYVNPSWTKLPISSPCAGPAHGAAEEAAPLPRQAGEGSDIAGGEDAV